jgi:hypothetical protein
VGAGLQDDRHEPYPRGGADSGCSQDPELSICLLTGRYGPVLRAFLASLAAQEEAPTFELLVAVDRDQRIADLILSAFPHAAVDTIKVLHPGVARNGLIEKARGDLIVFVDDDVVMGPRFLRRVVEVAAAHPTVGVFGGPNLTPPGSSTFQFVQGAVLGTIVASGPVRRRYGAHPAGPAKETTLTLCNLIVRRSIAVPFADDLVCAEENEAMRRLRREGVEMRFDPDLLVYHDRRKATASFAAQIQKYGMGRGQLLMRDPRALRPFHLAPTAFLVYLLSLPALALLVNPLFLLPLAAYVLSVAAGATLIAEHTGPGRPWRSTAHRFVLAALLIPLLHLAYGTGVPRGLATRRRASAAPEGSELRALPASSADFTGGFTFE